MREKIIYEATTLFAKRGYDATSMEEIARRCGITKPAIYYHFKNKKELYNRLFKHNFIPLVQRLEGVKNIAEYIHALLNFYKERPELAKLFLREIANEARNLEDETVKLLSRTLERLTLFLPKKVDTLFIQTVVVSTILTYLNTASFRKRVAKLRNLEDLQNIEKDLTQMVQLYLKEKR